jgi:hypothetical protein
MPATCSGTPLVTYLGRSTHLQVAETLVVVNEETREAEAKKVVVQGEEAAANEKAAAAKAIKVGM